jgi:hypothetical protein
MITGYNIGNALIAMNVPAGELPQDGARMLTMLEAQAARLLAQQVDCVIEKAIPELFDMFTRMTIEDGVWPAVSTFLIVPRMAQGEESMPTEVRQYCQAVHIARMERAKDYIEHCIETRPDAVEQYFGGGIK